MLVYAAPVGSDTGNCTLAEPCTLARAVTVATTAAVTPTLRLLSGTYLDPLSISSPTASVLHVVAGGATIMNGFGVTKGANVDVRDLKAASMACSDASISTTLTVSNAVLTGGIPTVQAQRCNLKMTGVDIAVTASTPAVFLIGPTDFHGERLFVHADSCCSTFRAEGLSVTSQVTNSVFEDIGVNPNTSDTTSPGSKLLFAFNTWVMGDGAQQDCLFDSGATHRTVLFENNIMKGTGTTDVSAGPTCTYLHNILSPQTNPDATNSTADPQFVDLATHDYHLKSSSPAVNAAVPSAGLDPASDFDGVTRPQGAAKDMGAFEFKP